uniref:Peptidyl-prolyl cis-trans isomerase CYP21-1 n=1 Tax=Rhizophora mucronata TaxID=61149 RepID=A0A2P2N669_RHIMU
MFLSRIKGIPTVFGTMSPYKPTTILPKRCSSISTSKYTLWVISYSCTSSSGLSSTFLGVVNAKTRKITRTMKRRRNLGWTQARISRRIVLMCRSRSLLYLSPFSDNQQKTSALVTPISSVYSTISISLLLSPVSHAAKRTVSQPLWPRGVQVKFVNNEAVLLLASQR